MKDVMLAPKHRIILGLAAAALLVMVFSGCQTVEMVKSNQVNLPDDVTRMDTETNNRIVYAVSTEMMTNQLTIRKFGIYYLDDSQVKVGHGLSNTIYINDMNFRMRSELNRVLRNYQYNSLDDFITKFQAQKPIVPGSQFVSLPSSLGTDLFILADKFRGWDDWVLRNRDDGIAP